MYAYSNFLFLKNSEEIYKSNIRKSIKFFIIRKWIDSGYPIFDHKISLSDIMKTYTISIINNNLINLNVDKIFDDMIDSASEENGEKNFTKFIFDQLGKSYIYKNLTVNNFYNIDRIINNRDKLLNEFRKEINELESLSSILFNNISKQELMIVLSDVIFYEVYSKYYSESISSLDDQFLIFKNSIENILSPLGVDEEIINKYENLLSIFGIELDNDIKICIKNNISNLCFGFNQLLTDKEMGIKNDFERNLSYYILDRLIYTNMDYLKNSLFNINLYRDMINKYSFEFLEDSFFSNNMNKSEFDTNIPPAFNQNEIETIYLRYNKIFIEEPEYFNLALINIYNNFSGSGGYSKSNFNSIFIPDKLNDFFYEYCSYYVWSTWLDDFESQRTDNSIDINGLVPQDLSTVQNLKNKIKQIYKDGLFSIKESKDKRLIKSFNPIDGSNSGLLPIEKKLILRENINNRLKTFKYVRFTLNGLTEYEKYKYPFFNYVENLYNTANEETINTMISNINSFYDSI